MKKKLFTLLLAVVASTGTLFASTVSSDGRQFYSSGSLTRDYTNSQGCDSVVSRNVIVSKAAAPKIIATPEQDTFNSGSIRIYNKYCTGSEYYEGQYNYFYQYAEYDYFTINGKKYNFSSAIEGEYNEYYHPDGIRVIDEPSTVIDNLSAGEYHIVFYSSCDSIAEDITIETKGIEIDGIYYIIQYSGLKVTYRGSTPDEYDEYSGNVIIPDSAIYNGEKLPIIDIDENAFHYSPNLSSITFNSILPSYYIYLNVQVPTLVIYAPFGTLETYKYMIQCYYYNYNYSHYFEYKYSYIPAVHVIHLQNVTKETSSTASIITIGNTEEQKHISSCGIVDGEERAGNVFEYTGLNPNKEYTDVPLYVKTIEGDYDIIKVSFTTPALKLTTKQSKAVSSTTAILLAETNMSDAEVNCGFEYKRNDAPADMSGTKVYCPVASGQMAGRLKNLKDDVYYKYRAFYQSTAGNMYYGDWQYIFTGDVTVEFDPILYTYEATIVKETEATISGYALAGSEDFTEQGFEYWAESRTNGGANAPRRTAAAIGEHKFVQASGIKMTVTLTNLDEGTVYKYRAYGKAGNQFFYGSEQTFTTQGEYEGDDSEGIDEVPSDDVQCTKAQKILRNGQIFILRGEKEYTVTGQEMK